MNKKDFEKSVLWILASVLMFHLFVFGSSIRNELLISVGEFLSPTFFVVSVFYFVKGMTDGNGSKPQKDFEFFENAVRKAFSEENRKRVEEYDKTRARTARERLGKRMEKLVELWADNKEKEKK